MNHVTFSLTDVSSELGTRLNVELAATERLDANFVDYLRNRGMDLTDSADSAADGQGPSHELLSPELQVRKRTASRLVACVRAALLTAHGSCEPLWSRDDAKTSKPPRS